jgi:hypothetical protein
MSRRCERQRDILGKDEEGRDLLQISPYSMIPGRTVYDSCVCVWNGRRARARQAKGKLDETIANSPENWRGGGKESKRGKSNGWRVNSERGIEG